MHRLQRLPLARMFSLIILAVAFVVSTVIQSIKYYQSKSILDENLASKAALVMQFARSEEKGALHNVDSKTSRFGVIAAKATNPLEEEILKRLQDHKSKQVRFKTPTRYVEAKQIENEKVIYVTIDLQTYHEALRNLIVSSVLLWLVNITILLAMINFLFRRLIVNRINEILGIIQKISQGNFIDQEIFEKERLEKQSRNEIDRIYQNLHQMVLSLKPVVEEVIKNSKEVVFESLYGYGKVKDNVKLIQQQNRVVHHSNEHISEIMELSNSLDVRLHELLEKSDRSVVRVEEGLSVAGKNIASSAAVVESMKATVEEVQELRKFAAEIAQTLSQISDIANETNLISLNAAIEAARAGEHGRGFAVVAEKIRQLADVSLENAAEINRIINAVQSNIDSVAKSAEETNEVIHQLGKGSEVLYENFKAIDQVIKDTGDTLKSFSQDFIVQEKKLQNVREDLQKVNESAALLGDNSCVVEASINTITQMSAYLQNVSDQFDVMVEKRESARKLIVPPVMVQVSDGRYTIDCYVYDISKGGISLIVTKKSPHFSCKIGSFYTLKSEDETLRLDGRQIQMVYVFNKKDETTMRVGAKFV